MAAAEDLLLIRGYDPEWQELFSRLAARVRGALGTLVFRVEHIGSTAVPGLAAKPVVDLDVAVAQSIGQRRFVASQFWATYTGG
jgi:GrpB-like predicted nucleotidyltransferase (UPF0157 family)